MTDEKLAAVDTQPKRFSAFCRKSEDEVSKLILGAGEVHHERFRTAQLAICNECIDLCNDIIAEDKIEAEKKSVKPSKGRTEVQRTQNGAALKTGVRLP